jgi:hypothetical protein
MTIMNVIWVVAAKALPAYRLWVRFSDGAEGEVELERFVFSDTRPIVAALRDPAAFARVRVQSDTVTWENGFDLAPEFLYDRRKASRDALAH